MPDIVHRGIKEGKASEGWWDITGRGRRRCLDGRVQSGIRKRPRSKRDMDLKRHNDDGDFALGDLEW